MNCWQRNKYASKQEAIVNAIGMVMKQVPQSTIVWQGEIFISGTDKYPKNVQKTIRTNMG